MKDLPRFMIDGRSVVACMLVGRILVDPILPRNFDNTANEMRPRPHDFWWMRPYVATYSADKMWPESDESIESSSRQEERGAWHKVWPGGIRYDVRRLDGGAWDRSTFHASFATLESAVEKAMQLSLTNACD